jgi:hypothetical protein
LETQSKFLFFLISKQKGYWYSRKEKEKKKRNYTPALTQKHRKGPSPKAQPNCPIGYR